jgi:hypothetical protein
MPSDLSENNPKGNASPILRQMRRPILQLFLQRSVTSIFTHRILDQLSPLLSAQSA